MSIWLRILVYLTKKITIFVVVGLFLMLVTFTAYDCANVYMVLNEGLGERASVILNNEEADPLNNFFTQGFIRFDTILENNPYEGYIIQDYDHHVKIKWLWVWPWRTSTRVTIAETTPTIIGRRIESSEQNGEEGLKKTPPSWENGEKQVFMKKINGQWKIDRIVMKKPIVISTEDENEKQPEENKDTTEENNEASAETQGNSD